MTPVTRSTPPHVLSDAMFRGVLVRERKRSDRSNTPVALLLVTLTERSARSVADRAAVIAAVDAVKRETDVIGWFDPAGTLGVIMADIAPSAEAFASDVEARLRRHIAGRLGSNVIEDIVVHLHVHPNSAAAGVEPDRTVDRLLDETDAPKHATAYGTAKRALDIVGSLLLLLLLSPVMAMVAALVKLTSRGPVFFRQERIGQRMQPFKMLKFRSMHVNCDSAIHQEFVSSFIKSGTLAQEAGKNGMYKLTRDPRITPVGGFLRKTSLDELPQLWNVVRGEMSLVGPRPPLQYEVAEYKAWHYRRVLDAKPGITGLWQVEGRSRTTFDEMVRLDLRHARRRSLWGDIKILLATPAAVIAGKGAA